MNPIVAGLAGLVVAAAVVAISARDPRTVILGLVVVMLAVPLVADPLADPKGLAARLVGTILAMYLLWIAVRARSAHGAGGPRTTGSRLGWPAEALLAMAGAVAGYTAHGLGAPAAGPAIASAAGFAIAALTVPAIATGRDVLRVGVGLMLLLNAALLVRTALGGTPEPLEQLLAAGLNVAIAGGVGAIAHRASSGGTGGYEFGDEQWRRPRREPDAHPIDPA